MSDRIKEIVTQEKDISKAMTKKNIKRDRSGFEKSNRTIIPKSSKVMITSKAQKFGELQPTLVNDPITATICKIIERNILSYLKDYHHSNKRKDMFFFDVLLYYSTRWVKNYARFYDSRIPNLEKVIKPYVEWKTNNIRYSIRPEFEEKVQFIEEQAKETHKGFENVNVYDDPSLKCMFDELEKCLDWLTRNLLALKSQKNMNYLRKFSVANKMVSDLYTLRDKKNEKFLEDPIAHNLIMKGILTRYHRGSLTSNHDANNMIKINKLGTIEQDLNDKLENVGSVKNCSSGVMNKLPLSTEHDIPHGLDGSLDSSGGNLLDKEHKKMEERSLENAKLLQELLKDANGKLTDISIHKANQENINKEVNAIYLNVNFYFL